MQKKKMDLNHLLAKYEGISSKISNSPLRQPNHHLQLQFQPQPHFSKTLQELPPAEEKVFTTTQQPTRSIQSNFTLTKSEVESFLLSMRQEVRTEERALAKCMQVALKNNTENFLKMLEKVRKELLELLEQAFHELEENIKQQLIKQSKSQSTELATIYHTLSAFDQDIDRLLVCMRGSEYRKGIAEVVTRDFNLEISELRAAADTAKTGYLQSREEIGLDRSQLEAIKKSLERLFFTNKRKSQPVSNFQKEQSSAVFNFLKDKPETPASQSRQRRSLFSCGAD